MSDMWLVEMNLSTLFSNTAIFHRGRISAASDVKILEVKYDLLPPDQLIVRGSIGGLTDNYTTIIKFSDISLKGRTPIRTLQGDKRISKINPRKKDVEVYCTCEFFKWAFNTQNHSYDALFEPERNIRTEQPIGSPRGRSPNPTGLPGLCKHLVALANYLKDEKIITNI